jgi:hypothetical protein
MTPATRRLALALALGLAAPTVLAAAPAAERTPMRNDDITLEEVLAAQRAWGEGLVRIATAHREGGAERGRAVAGEVLDGAYGFGTGPVLFKPTLTVAPQTFRTTRAGALAYFAGGNPAFASDNGFAFNGWSRVEVENAAIFIHGRTALTQGNVRLTDGQGRVTTVDKSWGFHRDDAGVVRIVLHHSSLPFTP